MVASDSGTGTSSGASGTTLPVRKGSITISLDSAGKFFASPDPGLLDRNIQVMQWTLDAPAGYQFAEPGITFEIPEPGDTSFKPWPGRDPIRQNNWQIRAFVDHKVPDGQQDHYKYDFHIVHPSRGTLSGRKHFNIDPDMENQPQP